MRIRATASRAASVLDQRRQCRPIFCPGPFCGKRCGKRSVTEAACPQSSTTAHVTTYTVGTALDPARAGLRYRIWLEENFVAVAAPSYLGKSALATSWRTLVSHDWILPERFTFLRRQVEEAFLRDGATPPVPVIESSNAATNVKPAAAGHGVTVVPERVLHETVAPRDVRVLALKPPLEPTRVALVYRATMEQNRRIGVLQEALALCLPQGASETSHTTAISRSRGSARAPGKS